MDKPTPKNDVFQANRDRIAPLLKTLRADGIGHMIDGKIVPSISGETFETKSPVDGAILASVARGNAEDVDRAATAAALAFKSWRDMGPAMRKKLLHRIADAIEDNAEDIAVLECIDTGQAYRFMAKAAVRAAENFRFFADKCAAARDGPNTPSAEYWNGSTRVPIPSWRRLRSAPPKAFVSSPTNARKPSTARTPRAMSTGTSPRACRSALLASSRPGTRRSCCRPGRLHRRSRPAAPSCTSRPNGRP